MQRSTAFLIVAFLAAPAPALARWETVCDEITEPFEYSPGFYTEVTRQVCRQAWVEDQPSGEGQHAGGLPEGDLSQPASRQGPIGFLSGSALRSCLSAGAEIECKAVRLAFVRGAAEGLAMGDSMARPKEEATSGPFYRCYERVGSADQLLS